MINTFKSRKQAVAAIESAGIEAKFDLSSIPARRCQERLELANRIADDGASLELVEACLGSPETGFEAVCALISESAIEYAIVQSVLFRMGPTLRTINGLLWQKEEKGLGQSEGEQVENLLGESAIILKAATELYSLARIASASLKNLGWTNLAEAFAKLGGEGAQVSTTPIQ